MQRVKKFLHKKKTDTMGSCFSLKGQLFLAIKRVANKYIFEKSTSTMKRAFLMGCMLCLGSRYCAAAEDASHKDDDFIMHHIKDSHDWHFTTISGHAVSLHLPIIIYSKAKGLEFFSSARFLDEQHNRVAYRGYELNAHNKIIAHDTELNFLDLSITKNIAAMLLSAVVLIFIFFVAASRYRATGILPQKGLWNLLEALIIFVRDDIALPNIGKHYYKKYLPYLLSVFFFIWLNNILGLLPGAANVTGNISTTLLLACFTFLITTFSGKKSYWAHVFKTPGVPIWLLPIMIPIEVIGLFTKPISLMIRLFANITAGHIILLSIINLVFVLKSPYVGIVSVGFGAFMFVLKLLVAFLQAYIFSLLSAIYIGSAVAEADH